MSDTVIVKDGFYRWTHMTWSWASVFDNAYDRQAITALLHPRVLVEQTHPLCEAGKETLELYIGTMSNGLKKLLYTQKQMEYIVEYIYHHRLAEPAWVAYLADKKAALEAGKPEPSPPPADPKSRRLALPNTLLPKELFVDIETVSLKERAPKALVLDMKKYNKKVQRGEEATVFPATLDEVQAPPSPSASTDASPLSSPDPEFSVLPGQPSDPEQQDWQQSIADILAEAESTPTAADPADYFDLAQTALFVAGQGGAFRALDKKNPPGWNTSKIEELLTPSVGRGLFIALEMRSRDDDPTAPVDVGYAAQWYAPDPADPEKWEEGLECGHWVAEEDPRNGDEPLPEYHFGSTLPHPRANLSSLVNRKMLELWSRAGRGPVYILNHSASSDYTRLGALGIPVAGWLAELDPVEWSRPAHAAPEALGKRILLDTALLWGAVEKGQPGDTTEPSSGVSTRSVKEILEIMESGEFTAMDNENNSGNKAMLTYILFHTLLNRGPLKDIRNWAYLLFMRDMLAKTVADKSEDEPPEYDSDDDPDYTGMRAGYTNEQGEFVYFDDSDE